jgi:predicted phosphodiesterase
MINPSDINRMQDESIDDYLIRLGNNKDLYSLNWIQVADKMNAEAKEDFGESKWRKDYFLIKRGFDLAVKNNVSENEVLQEIQDNTYSLKKERVKLQSEKLELNKIVREQSRAELLEEKIFEAISNRQTITPPTIVIKPNNQKRDYLMPIADTHYGVEFLLRGWEDEILNQYSPEIAQKRMWDLLEQFVAKNDEEKIGHVHLPNLGDSLDGLLRIGQIASLKLGVVDSAIEYGEFLSTWLKELSKYVKIDYYSLQGNHTELRLLSGKRGDFPHENIEKVVTTIIKANSKGNENITVHPCNYFMYKNILGTQILGVHGQDEKNLETSIKDYALTYNKPVDMLISGHLHHSHEKTIGMNGLKDIEYNQMPSIIGIDDFSLKIKKTSNAAVKLMILAEEVGRVTTHNLKLR